MSLSFRNYLTELKADMSIEKTLTFIKKAHSGQIYGNKPYWTHPKQVADTGRKIFGSKFDHDAYIAALLHDVIEDTSYDEKQLLDLGFTKTVISAVKLLTKNTSLSYSDNIKRIVNSGNRTAMMVKYADNYVNFTGDYSKWNAEKRKQLQINYMDSMEVLGSVLGANNHTKI